MRMEPVRRSEEEERPVKNTIVPLIIIAHNRVIEGIYKQLDYFPNDAVSDSLNTQGSLHFSNPQTNRRSKQLGAPISSTNGTAQKSESCSPELCSPTANSSARSNSVRGDFYPVELSMETETVFCPIKKTEIFTFKTIGGKASKYESEYEHRDFLGKGAFGFVVACTHTLDGNDYAVKWVRFGQDNLSFHNVQSEAKEMCNLFHSNAVRYFSTWYEPPGVRPFFGEVDLKAPVPYHYICIQMELCDKSLDELLKDQKENGKKGLESKALSYFIQILEGLSYLHNKDVIHGDLKLDNILLHDDQLKICDFGTAKHTREASYVKDMNAVGLIFFQMVNGINQNDLVAFKYRKALPATWNEQMEGVRNLLSTLRATSPPTASEALNSAKQLMRDLSLIR